MTINRLSRIGLLLALGLLSTACSRGGVRDGELEGAKEKSPADLYVKLAAEYYKRGDIETALRNIQKGLEEDSKNAEAHNVIATIYQQLEQNSLAEKHFRTALSLDPKSPYILTAWGNFLCDKGQYSEAEAQFRKALGAPLHNARWMTLASAGVCSRKAGRSQQAETYLRQALTANPRYAPALFQMAQLDYDLARFKSARNYLKRYFQARGYTPKSLVLAVRIERRLGARKSARTYERLLRKNFPDTPEAVSI